ncbi:MAG: dephospho-CoA kinase [bacterium]|nr:dephospho-CoA kinase [bacterium]
MLKIGITGNIAAGKTQVENYLLSQGYKVLDTDKTTHELLKNTSIKNEIAKRFNDVFEKDEISRKKLGNIVFSDEKEKQKLEKILHPEITKKIIEFFNNNQQEKFVFISASQLFEAKLENLFDKILLIFADDKIRQERLITRNNLTEEAAKIRLNAQMPQEQKQKLSDFTINNNSTLDALYKQTAEILTILKNS